MDAWLNLAKQTANQTPSAPRLPLLIDGIVIGSVGLATADFLLSKAAAHITQKNDALHIPNGNVSEINLHLAAIAQTLHQAQMLRGWRNELLSIAAPNLSAGYAIERGAVRALGIASSAVHLCGITPNGEHWLQRRAAHKATDPNKLDTLAGGLVAAGESIETGLIREAYEEAGVPLALAQQAKKLGVNTVTRPVPEGFMVEYSHVYCLSLPFDFAPQNIDGEASGFERLSQSAVIAEIERGQLTLEAVLALGMAFAP